MTTSGKQIAANRQNAKLGGVKTESGKEVSRWNATKHGLLSKEVLLKEENMEDLVELRQQLNDYFQPETGMEQILVDRIIANVWRLKRALKIETEMIEGDCKPGFMETEKKNLGSALSYDFANNDTYGKLIRYETSIERGFYRALHELQRIQAKKKGESVPLPAIVDVDLIKDE